MSAAEEFSGRGEISFLDSVANRDPVGLYRSKLANLEGGSSRGHMEHQYATDARFRELIAAWLWIPSFFQKERNSVGAKGFYFRGKAPWTYLFGVRPGVERIYLVEAYLQILMLLCFSAGLIAVWFFGLHGLLELFRPMVVSVLLGTPLAIADRLKQRK